MKRDKNLEKCIRDNLPPKGSPELKGKGTYARKRAVARKECVGGSPHSMIDFIDDEIQRVRANIKVFDSKYEKIEEKYEISSLLSLYEKQLLLKDLLDLKYLGEKTLRELEDVREKIYLNPRLSAVYEKSRGDDERDRNNLKEKLKKIGLEMIPRIDSVGSERSPDYRSFYTGDDVLLSELLEVDDRMSGMDDDEVECVRDVLENISRSINRPRKKPYIHENRDGYDVLNVSRKDLNEAVKKCEGNYVDIK